MYQKFQILIYYFGKTKNESPRTEELTAFVFNYNHSKNEYDNYVVFGKYKPLDQEYACYTLIEYEGYLNLPTKTGREFYENLRNFTEAIRQRYPKIQENPLTIDIDIKKNREIYKSLINLDNLTKEAAAFLKEDIKVAKEKPLYIEEVSVIKDYIKRKRKLKLGNYSYVLSTHDLCVFHLLE